MKNLLYIFCIVFCIGTSAFSAPCTEPYTCGTSTSCDNHVKKFSSYTAFETWVNANQWTAFEVIYSSSTTIIIQTSENCMTKNTCWDSVGECQ